MSALTDTFAAARQEGRAALVGYLPAGFPSVAGGIAAARAMVAAGVDVVEIGLPYTDPLMDGPVIQAAVEQALAGGIRTRDVLATVEAVAATGAPTLVMSYWNPIERFGPQRFAAELRAAGAAGAITPDLIPEEADDWRAAALAEGLDPVFLVAPSSTPVRLAAVAAASRGFVYAASTMGVTGTRNTVSGQAADLVARLRPITGTPVAVGLGVSSRQQAAQVARFADGVIVGSALVRALGSPSAGEPGILGLERLVAELAQGVRGRLAGESAAAPRS